MHTVLSSSLYEVLFWHQSAAKCNLQDCEGHCWLQTAQQYTAFAEPDDDAGSRDDPGYVQWYLDHGKAYQQADPGRVSLMSSA